MRVVVPYDAVAPKSRLEPMLEADEREAFGAAMLRDVLDAVRETGREPEVLANAPLDDGPVDEVDSLTDGVDVPVTVDERPLTPAVDAVLDATEEPVAVVMADLALATPAALDRLFSADGDVVLAPGRGGGTNALLARHPAFRVDYHGASYLDHLAAAREVGAGVAEVDSFRLSTDVDEPADLADLLVHGDGRATAWLRDAGVSLSVADGRVGVVREG